MATIREEFTFQGPEEEMTISVLEPTKSEMSHGTMLISVDFGMSQWLNMKEYRMLIAWMSERADYIEQNFEPSGKPKANKD